MILSLVAVKLRYKLCDRVRSGLDGTFGLLTCSSPANHPTCHPSAVPAWISVFPAVHQSASHGNSRSAASTVVAVVVPATAAVACRRHAAVGGRPDRSASGGKRQSIGHCGVVAGWVLRGGPGASFGLPDGACQSGGSSGARPGPTPCHANPMARRSTDIFFRTSRHRRISSSWQRSDRSTRAFIAQDDEVLDWREMVAFCTGAQVRPVQGSDHALSDFDAHLPTILDFLRLA